MVVTNGDRCVELEYGHASFVFRLDCGIVYWPPARLLVRMLHEGQCRRLRPVTTR
jgi:hypothetical protein